MMVYLQMICAAAGLLAAALVLIVGFCWAISKAEAVVDFVLEDLGLKETE